MKWLKRAGMALVLFVVLTIACLLLAGMRPGAGQTAYTVEIARPASQVYALLMDPQRLTTWSEGVAGVKPLNDIRGPGSVERITVAMHDKELTIYAETIALEPEQRVELKLTSVGETFVPFTERVVYTLETQNGRTRLTQTGRSTYGSFLARLLEPMITSSAQKKLEGDLTRLKGLLEASPPG